MRGIVKFFTREKGFGVAIQAGDGRELFFHSSHLHEPLAIPLAKDEEIEFDIAPDPKRDGGEVATNVKRIGARYSGIVKDYKHTYGFIECTETGERIFAHCSEVVNDGFKRLEDEEQVEFSISVGQKGKKQATKIFRVETRPRLLQYAHFPDFDRSIEELHALDASRDWEYRNTNSANSHPILRSYVFNTFERVESQGKIFTSVNAGQNPLSCFNTGLATSRQEPIYGLFQSNSNAQRSEPSWVFRGFVKESDHALTHFAEKPGLANYFTDPGELLYDSRVELTINIDHIIGDNIERFPKELQDNDYVRRGAFQSALEFAKRRVERNYKAAVPSFYRGRIQLLLPLCMLDPEKADLALVVARENEVYRASTVLTLDMAFNNARLIARPDREWLDP